MDYYQRLRVASVRAGQQVRALSTNSWFCNLTTTFIIWWLLRNDNLGCNIYSYASTNGWIHHSTALVGVGFAGGSHSNK